MNKRNKLKQQDVIDICNLAAGGLPLQDIARQFDVHPSTISRIVSGKAWGVSTDVRHEEGLIPLRQRVGTGIEEEANQARRSSRIPQPIPDETSDSRDESRRSELELIEQRRRSIENLGDAAGDGITSDLEAALTRNELQRIPDKTERVDYGRTGRTKKVRQDRTRSFQQIYERLPLSPLCERAAATEDTRLKAAIERVFNALPEESWTSEQAGRLVAQVYEELAGEEKDG